MPTAWNARRARPLGFAATFVVFSAGVGCLGVLGDFNEETATVSTTGGQVCEPDVGDFCYDGPDGTEGVGQCATGLRTCNHEGSAYGACEGQVGPAAHEDCSKVGDEDCDGVACSDLLSGSVYGDAVGNALATSVAFGPSGELVVAGAFAGSIDFGSGAEVASNEDLFVVKLDAEGKLVFAHRYGGRAALEEPLGIPLRGPAVAVDGKGDILVAGGFAGSMTFGDTTLTSLGDSYDVFVAKLDPDGKAIWSQRFGDDTSDQVATQIHVDAADNAVIAGAFMGSVDFGTGPLSDDSPDNRRVFIAQLSATDGEGMKARAFGDPAFDTHDVVTALDSTGDLLLAGSFQGTINLGMNDLSSPDDLDLYAAKLDTAWTPRWTRSFPGKSEQYLPAIAADAKGNAVITGTTLGIVDFGASTGSVGTSAGNTTAYVVELENVSGDAIWSDGFAQMGNNSGDAVGVDGKGDIVVSGRVEESIDFGGGGVVEATASGQLFLVKLDKDGKHVWSKNIGGQSGVEALLGLAVDRVSNRIALAGQLLGEVSIDGKRFTAASNSGGAFIATFAP